MKHKSLLALFTVTMTWAVALPAEARGAIH